MLSKSHFHSCVKSKRGLSTKFSFHIRLTRRLVAALVHSKASPNTQQPSARYYTVEYYSAINKDKVIVHIVYRKVDRTGDDHIEKN